MAKPKEQRNMSALDYLYKKLYRLGNKIEALSKGKISKRDLLIYVFAGIFIVSVYFGKVIGGFTFVLVLVTLWNTRITQDLLKRSTETFEHSRISFLVDIVDRTIEHVENIPKHEIAEQAQYIMSKVRAINKINREIGSEFYEVMIIWTTARHKLEIELEELKRKSNE